MQYLHKEKTYTVQLDYIFNQYIREYDISKANISVLYTKNFIGLKTYELLYNSDRMYRQIYIGKMIADNSYIQEVLNDGIIEYKEKFFIANGIEDDDILAIKNDAVFVLNKVPTILSFDDNIHFRHRNTYTSFMKLDNMEIYYGLNFNEEVIDVKGIKDIDIETYHMDFLDIIINFMRYIQKDGPIIAHQYITLKLMEYVELKLPISFYRRFRSSNDYVFNALVDSYSTLYLPDDQDIKNKIDISYNLNLLRQMHMYASQLLYKEVSSSSST